MDGEMALGEQSKTDEPALRAKADAVAALAQTLDTNFFKAIADPVRQQIVLILLQEGRLGIQEVTKHMVQDRSVISRHLTTLKQAGLVRSHRLQRSTEYELDGPTIITKLEQLLARMRMAALLCCPPTDSLR